MPLPGAFTSKHRAQKVFITSIILIVKRGSIQLFTYKCSAGSSKLSEIMDLEHGKRRDKIMDRDSEWIHNAEKKGVYFVWGPVAHTYLYTNVYQGRAWFDQIIENSTSRYSSLHLDLQDFVRKFCFGACLLCSTRVGNLE